MFLVYLMINDLKDSQREGSVGFPAGNDIVSGSSVHVDAGDSVQFGVGPVQTLVDHICPNRMQLWLVSLITPFNGNYLFLFKKTALFTQSDAIGPFDVVFD